MGTGELIAAITVLAILTEWLSERFFGKWITGEAMVYLSTVVGIALCLLFQVDGVKAMGLPAPLWSPWTGEVITGLIVGAGSNAVHKFFDKYLPPAT